MQNSRPPLWRRAFDQAERMVGRPLEDLVGTRQATDALIGTFRLQGAIYRAYERRTRAVLHLLNLPARSDVARLNRQLTTLTSEVRELAARLEVELEEEREARR